MNTKDLQERILFCQNVLQEIRPVILDGFQNPRIVSERKKDGSEVTEIDRRVEELVCKKIMQLIVPRNFCSSYLSLARHFWQDMSQLMIASKFR